jgi:hypothetical protein
LIAKPKILRAIVALCASGTMTCGAAPPVIDYFQAEVDPAQPIHGRVLRWQVLGADQLVIDGGIGNVTARSEVVPLVTASSVWKYLDQGSDEGTAWRAPDFNDQAWDRGAGKLGYGDSDVVTSVGFGGNPTNKYATTYFRRTFEVAGVDTLGALTLGLRYDDGAIVYLNGREIARYNLPEGEIAYDFYADLDAPNDGRDFETTPIPASALVEGRNVLAVEIHQEAGNDSDISFDLRLEATTPSAARILVSENKLFRLTATNTEGATTADVAVTLAANAACVYLFDEATGTLPVDLTTRTLADFFPAGIGGVPQGDGEALAFVGDRSLRLAGASLADFGARFGDGMTLGFWVRANAGAATVVDALKLGRGFQLLASGGAAVVRFNGNASTDQALEGVFDGTWHHLAIAMLAGDAVTPGTVRLYRDGVREASVPWEAGIRKTPRTWIIGGAQNGTEFFIGSLKQLGVFDGALGDAEILTMCSDGPGTLAAPRVIGFSPADPTLVAGATGRLHWQVVNAPAREVTVAPSSGVWNPDGLGGLPVMPSAGAVYTLTATGPLGSAAATTGFVFGTAPEILRFSAQPNPILLGGSGNLEWDVVDALQVDISPGIGRVSAMGDATISPQSRTDYALVAANRFGSVTETLGVGTDSDPAPGAWTLAFIPDTQHYVDNVNNVPIYDQFMSWIVDHAAARNIRFVAHVGDIVQNNTELEWNRVMPGINRVLPVVPMGLAPGNHDYQSDSGSRVTQFNRADRCGPGSPYAAQPTLRGIFPGDAPGRYDNTYHTFVANGQRYLIVCLEFGPRDPVVTWADGIVAAHPDHHAILVTHAYLYRDNTRYDWAAFGSSQGSNPHQYSIASDPAGVNDGEEIWQKLARKHPNVALVLCGHVQPSPYFMTSIGDAGNPVHQMMFDPQAEAFGGNGFVRFLEFQPDGQTVRVKTYSPYYDSLGRDAWRTDPANMFDLSLAPLPAPPDADGDQLPDAWENAHGLDPASATDVAGNPDHDQWPNLWEYVFGFDPNMRDHEPGVAGATVTLSGEDYGTFTYRRRIGLTAALQPQVQVSWDGRTWATEPGDGSLVIPESCLETGDGSEAVTVRLVEPIGLSGQCFFRVAIHP